MVKNFYQPTVAPKWTDPLSDAYADELNKLDRYHQAAREADQSRTDAVIGADKVAGAISDLGSIAKFSKTVADHIDKKKQEKFEVDYRSIEDTQKEAIKEIFDKGIDLTKGSDNVIKKLKDSGAITPEVLTLLTNNSAGNSLRLRRVLGHDSVKNSISDLDWRLEKGPNRDILQSAYESAVQNGTVEDFYKKDIYKKLNKLGFNNSFIATHFKDEVQRIAETKGALASLEYEKVQLTKEVETDVASLVDLDYAGKDFKADNATFTLQGLLTKHGKTKTAGILHRLLKSGDLPSDAITLMQEGKTVDFPAGDTGQSFFDQKTWDYINSGATEFQNTTIANAQAEGEGRAKTLLTQLYQKDSPFTSQEQWSQAIQPLKGRVSQKTWTALENQNSAAQGQIQYNRYKSQYSESERNGTLDQDIESIKTIPNFQAREELLVKAQRIKTWKDDPANEKAYDETNIEGEVFTARAGTAFDKSATIVSNEDNIITQDLLSFRRQDLSKRILAQYDTGTFIPNPNIAIENAQALEAYKEANGWGQPVNSGAGKFTLTGKPEDKQWGNYFKKYQTSAYNHNAPLSENAGKNFDLRVRETPTKADRHAKAEGIFSNDQLISWLKTGKLSQDMMYIQTREGEPMSDLLERGLRALVTSAEKGDENNKAIVERYNIKEISDTMPTPDRIILSRLLGRVKASEGNQKELASNLVSLFKWYGPEVLLNSPKITQQLFELSEVGDFVFDAVDTVDVPENVTTKAAKDARARRLVTLGVTDVDPAVLDSDEAVDEYIKKLGLIDLGDK